MKSKRAWSVVFSFSVVLFLAGLYAWAQGSGQGKPAAAATPAPAAKGAATPPSQAPDAVPGEPDWSPPVDYDDFLRKYYRVLKVEKSLCKKLSADRIFVNPPLSATYELVREDAEYYYIRNLPLDDPDSHLHKQWEEQNLREIVEQQRDAYMRDKYIIVDEPDIYPPFVDKLEFERTDTGLPKNGQLVRSFDVADMNGDGLPDLVLPPERMGMGKPMIFLQQKDHSWRQWENVRWPSAETRLDYGTVRVADFNGDGHPDIAIACHFLPSYVLYGDGKGDFSKVEKLPVLSPDVTFQALTVGDFNGDGRPDIALLAELDLSMTTNKLFKTGVVNVVLNLPGGWKATGDDFPPQVFGYGLAAADLDHDGSTDLILTSREQGVRALVFRNLEKGGRWEAMADRVLPYNGFVYSVAVGSLDRFPAPDLVACYQQNNPRVKETPTQACTIYRFHDDNGKPLAEPRTELLLKHKEQFNGYLAVAIGDVDGDGRNDIAVVTTKGQLQLFLQLPDGHFYEQKSAAFNLGEGTMPSDVRIADLHGDGKGEIIVMGTRAPESKLREGGGMWVFTPKVKAPVTAKGGS